MCGDSKGVLYVGKARNASGGSEQYTIRKIQVPPASSPRPVPPEFLRLPKPGHLCAWTGLSRSYLNLLILPTATNGHKPPVRSFVLRQPGARTGVRLVDYADLRRYIRAHAETGTGQMQNSRFID